jgi:hypothetical protein
MIMSDAKKVLDRYGLLAFIGGAVAAVIAPKVLKSNCVRKAAVRAVAKGMQLQDSAVSAFEEIREDAQDIYCEAKDRARAKSGSDAEEGTED